MIDKIKADAEEECYKPDAVWRFDEVRSPRSAKQHSAQVVRRGVGYAEVEDGLVDGPQAFHIAFLELILTLIKYVITQRFAYVIPPYRSSAPQRPLEQVHHCIVRDHITFRQIILCPSLTRKADVVLNAVLIGLGFGNL